MLSLEPVAPLEFGKAGEVKMPQNSYFKGGEVDLHAIICLFLIGECAPWDQGGMEAPVHFIYNYVNTNNLKTRYIIPTWNQYT